MIFVQLYWLARYWTWVRITQPSPLRPNDWYKADGKIRNGKITFSVASESPVAVIKCVNRTFKIKPWKDE